MITTSMTLCHKSRRLAFLDSLFESGVVLQNTPFLKRVLGLAVRCQRSGVRRWTSRCGSFECV